MTRLQIYNPERLNRRTVRRDASLRALAIDAIALVLLGIVVAMLCGCAVARAGYPQSGCPGGVCPRPSVPPTFAMPGPVSQPCQPQPARCRVHVSGDGSTGSGTLVDPGCPFVITAGHIFRDSRSGIVCTFPDGQRFAGQLVELDETNDLAAVMIGRTNITPAAVDANDATGELIAGGFGGDGRFMIVCGRVVGHVTPHGATNVCAVMTGATRSGDSGGAVVNRSRVVVGVVWGSRDGQTYFTFGRPLAEFLGRVRSRLQGSGAAAAVSQPNQTPPLPPVIAPPSVAPPASVPNLQLPPPVAAPPAAPIVNLPAPDPPVYVPPAALPPQGSEGAQGSEVGGQRPGTNQSAQRSEVGGQGSGTNQAPPAAAVPPPAPPSVYAPGSAGTAGPPSDLRPPTSDPFDRLGTAAIGRLLVAIGVGGGVTAAVALPVWLVAKYLARRRLKKKLAAAAGGEGDPSVVTFHRERDVAEPIARDLREARQLLELGQLEGSHPLLESVAGQLTRSRLERDAESHDDPHIRQYAKDLSHDVLKRFHQIAPPKLTLTGAA